MLHGIFGQPFLDLERALAPYVDLAELDAIHEEICLGLANVPVDYTGGSHRSMGIMPPSRVAEAGVDYGEVLASMSAGERRAFRDLADDPSSLPDADALDPTNVGEEREHALSRRQMLWLERRFGVYFPWKVYVELIPNRYWDEKSTRANKDFTRVARTFFPKTIALVQRLPFAEVGRCNVMGLAANDHGTVHRDGIPEEKPEVDHFITLCPAGNKRLFLWDEDERASTLVTPRAVWFNDSDYHGVEADPFFRYSIRIDGRFAEGFLDEVRADARNDAASKTTP